MTIKLVVDNDNPINEADDTVFRLQHSIYFDLGELLLEGIDTLDRHLIADICERARRLAVKANLYGRGGRETDLLSAAHTLSEVLDAPEQELINVHVKCGDEVIDSVRALEMIADACAVKAVKIQNAKGAL